MANQTEAASETTTRDRLIEAAMRLFLENGYAATGITAILRKAGVRSGSLYYFFKSKDDLLKAVLERYLELLHPFILGPAEAKSDDPIERVFCLLALYRGFLTESGCRYGCPVGNLALEVSDTHESAREQIRANFDNWCGGVQRWLEDAGDRLPRNLDRASLAQFILTVMEGGQMQAKARKRIEAFDTSVAQLRRYFDCLVQEASRDGKH